MSGRNKNNITLTQHGVVTQEAMLAYLAGMLSVEDTARFEQLIAEDPFAHEALEGLQSLQSTNGLKQTLLDVNTQIQEQSGGKVTPMPASGSILRYAVAAAVIGVLIGFGFLLTQYFSDQTNSLAENANRNETVAVQEEIVPPAADEQIVPVADSVLIDSSTIQADTNMVYRDENAAAGTATAAITEQEVRADKTLALKEKAAAKPETALAKKEAESKDAKKAIAAKQEEVSKRPAPAAAPPVAESMVVTSSSKWAKDKNAAGAASDGLASDESVMDDKAPATIESAMNSFNAKKYPEAAKQFHALQKKQPDNADVLYFGGVSEYINGNSNKALNNFDKLLSSGNKYTDGAKWYKSQILLQKGKKDQAKQLMKDLSSTNGIYRERAIQKLEDLNK